MSAESDRGRCGLAFAKRAMTSIATVAGVALMVLGASCGGSSAAPPADGAIIGDAGTPYADPNDHAISINEIMAANALSAKDDTGAAAPWVELYNPTSGDISLGGYALTDDFNQPRRAVLPAGSRCPPVAAWCCGATGVPRSVPRTLRSRSRPRVAASGWRVPTDRSSIASPTARRSSTSPARASPTARRAGSPPSGTFRRAPPTRAVARRPRLPRSRPTRPR